MGSCVKERIWRSVLCLACLALTLTAAGCMENYDPAPLRMASVVSVSRPYVLRPNDRVRVQVYNEPTISGDYQIDGAGYLSIPLAGRLKAAGLTTAHLERAVMRHLDGGILKDPHVSVEVSGYGPFYIRGEVKRPGQFPYAPGMTVGDAVALAGGYTYRANESVVYVRHSGGVSSSAVSLNSRVPVAPGDDIRIPERYF